MAKGIFGAAANASKPNCRRSPDPNCLKANPTSAELRFWSRYNCKFWGSAGW